MFHMLSCFNLQEGVSAGALDKALKVFAAVMQEKQLLVSVSPIGHRDSDTEMDTDEERAHEYFYIMSFEDKKQCDDAYDFIDNPTKEALAAHMTVVSKIQDNIHICWEDIQARP